MKLNSKVELKFQNLINEKLLYENRRYNTQQI